ncbi:MAG: hypothetical protein IPM85_05955 [Chitinophagaceae bacterium]|nr:hypothetical protein [Chitinophagaceae bacterium]
MYKKNLLPLILSILLPLTGNTQVPVPVPPSKPLVGLTQQHLYYPANFIHVYSATVDGVLYASYSYNVSTVKNDLAEGSITCWLLEEWTAAGRVWLLAQYRTMGYDTTGMGGLHYLYYPITYVYDDPVTLEPYAAPQYEYIVKEGGEVCGYDKKVITFVNSSSRYARIDEVTQVPFLRLAEALKSKYNL